LAFIALGFVFVAPDLDFVALDLETRRRAAATRVLRDGALVRLRDSKNWSKELISKPFIF
jgi:hypothetical protein